MRVKNLRALLRYNFGIIWGHTPWLLIIPVAASMLVLFWNMAMASMFTPSKVAQTTEGLAPILAAFLCAHLLGVEYRFRIGEITFAKPFAGRRILYLRLLAVYLLVAFLVAVMLFVYAKGIGTEFSSTEVVLAGVPSVLFLSMLSLMLATLTRQPMVGVAVAGLYWAADLYGGVEFHPLLSLQGYAAFLRAEELAASWKLSKGILLALGLLLYLVNVRLVGRPEGIRSRAKMARNAGLLAVVAALYLYTGALAKVAYGLRHDHQWPNQARVWYRERFRVYGSLPVAPLLGPGFTHYLGPLTGDPEDRGRGTPTRTTPKDTERLQRLLRRWPRSHWADRGLYALARAAQSGATEADLAAARSLHQRLAEQYPDSPFAPAALLNLGALCARMGDPAEAEQAYQWLIERHPRSQEALEGLQKLTVMLHTGGRPAEALRWTETLRQHARPEDVPLLLQHAGDLLLALGRPDEARVRFTAALTGLDAQIEALDAQIGGREAVPTTLLERHNNLLRTRRALQTTLASLSQ